MTGDPVSATTSDADRDPGPPLDRAFFAREVTLVALDLLGRIVVADGPQGPVVVRLTEVEAYAGSDDPASHAYRGRTSRTAVMFGPPGHLYTYFVYGMHWCANVVTGPDGDASAVLLRAGEVVSGLELARLRRPTARRDDHLARGPAGLAAVLGWARDDNGLDLCAPPGDTTRGSRFHAGRPPAPADISAGPRVGVGRAVDVPWRFRISGAPSVSAFRSGTRASRRTNGVPATGEVTPGQGPRAGKPGGPSWQDGPRDRPAP